VGASGVHGLALMGSTGEFVHFTLEERIRLVSLGVKRSRVPVIVGVGHSTFDGALALARAAAGAGADALLLPPPYFFPYEQEDIAEFYLRFASEYRDGPPVLLYNIPQFASAIHCDTAIDLMRSGRFGGAKDSSGDWEQFERLNAARRGRPFALLAGQDRIFRRARQAGADGVVSGCACAVPELLVALDRAALTGRGEAAERLDARLQEFVGWTERFPPPIAIREATALRGSPVGVHAVPLGAAGQARLEEFRQWFGGWLPAILEESRNV
jgi:4-hydroxy-tetrahydrodipicolinate synthase